MLCKNLGIDFDNIAKLELKTNNIKIMKASASTKLSEINEQLREDNKKGPVWMLNQDKTELEKLKAELDQDNKNYQQYLKDLEEWKGKCADIEGNKDNPEEGTIHYYENILKRINESIPDELQGLKLKRSEKIRDIYNKMDELKKDYEFLYASVKEFMKSAPFSEPDRFLLDFDVSIQCKDFFEKFFDYIGQNKKGSFYGIEEGKDRLRGLLDVADFNTYEGLEAFI